MRGEDVGSNQRHGFPVETPPHAWGRPHQLKRALNRMGNTPTCVGKTLYMDYSILHLQKHPHMRGEDACRIHHIRRQPETPPHAWGRLMLLPSTVPTSRNTPTCVGKTTADLVFLKSREKHPHMRGEDSPTKAR